MKNLKKLASLALALVMTLALMVPAFADDTESGSDAPATTGTITIENTKEGATYNIYRIFDATVSGEHVSYTISSKWKNFFAEGAAGAGYIVTKAEVPAGKEYDPITVGNETKYIAIDDSNVVEFADAALNYALATETKIDVDATITGTGDSEKEENMPFGYYMTYMVGASEQTSESKGSICSLTPVSKDATLKIKATLPTITKTSNDKKEVTAQIDKDVPFTIKGTVPDASNFETYTYKVSDKMSAGLTLNKNVTVMIGDESFTPSDEQLVYTEEGDGFELSIPVMNYQNKIGAEIVITYSAKVNEKAVNINAETNEATLTYSNDPADGNKTTPTTPEVVKVYTYYFDLVKTDSDNVLLNGAEFKLYDAKTEGNEILLVKDGDFYRPAVEGETAAEAIEVTGGKVAVKGLSADVIYWLEETKAPAGYNQLAERKEVSLTAEVSAGEADAEGVEKFVTAPANLAADVDGNTYTSGGVQVINLTGTELPETGGIGTTIFYTMGALLVVSAGILLITKKRMSAV